MKKIQRERESADILTLIESGDYIPISEGMYYDTINERAKFSFVPKFKSSNEVKGLTQAAKEAEAYLNSEGMAAAGGTAKGWRIAFKILGIIEDSGSVFYIGYGAATVPTAIAATAVTGAPVVIPVIALTVLGYLATRLWSWAFRYGEEEMAKKNSMKLKTQLIGLQKKAGDKKSKDKIQSLIDKIDKKIDNANKN